MRGKQCVFFNNNKIEGEYLASNLYLILLVYVAAVCSKAVILLLLMLINFLLCCFYCLCYMFKKASEYDHDIPQSHCTPTYGTMSKSYMYITITRHQQDKQSKATSSLFPIKMIAALERTLSYVQQNME